jgi:hypothetical protein
MLAQLKQVAINYVTRPTPLEWAMYLILLPFLWTMSTVDRNEPQLLTALMSMPFAMLPAAAIKNQLRWQFAHPRVHLMPGFGAPHLAVAWMVLVLFAVIAPLIAQWSSPHSLWPFLFCAALGAAIVQLPQQVAGLTTPLFLLWIFGKDHFDNAAIADWLNAVGYRRPLLITGTLLAWSAVLVAHLKLLRQREDDRGFQPPVLRDTGDRLSRTFRAAKERAASVESARRLDRSWWTSARIDRSIAAASKLPSWRRLDLAFTEPMPPLTTLAGVSMTIVCWVMIIFARMEREGAWDGEQLRDLAFVSAILVAVAAVVPAINLSRRLPQMTTERVLPLSKRNYTNSILFVCLWRSARYWLALQLLAAIVVFALPWQGLEPVQPAHVIGYLAISLAGLTCACGVSWLFSLYSGFVPHLFAAAIIGAATMGLQIYWAHLLPHESQGAALVWAFLFTAIGIACALIARIEWRDKEYAAALSDRFA